VAVGVGLGELVAGLIKGEPDDTAEGIGDADQAALRNVALKARSFRLVL